MGRHFAPLMIPLGALVSAAVIIYGISRVLLSFSREITPFVALAIALVVLVACTWAASRVSSAGETS